MSERYLHFDNVRATGLNPVEVSEHSQAFQIFSPESKKYVRVEDSFAKKAENESNFVSVDEDYRGGNKKFLLVKIGENEYNIKSVDDDTEKETGFLYVSEHTTSGLKQSSSNVLQSKTIAFKEELYVFEFIRHSEQKGVYKIRCKANGKVLFASNDRGHHVNADLNDHEKSNRAWFQLSIKPHMDIKVCDAEGGKHILHASEEPMFIDEVYNELKYGMKQRFPGGVHLLTSYMKEFVISDKTNLKANKDLNAATSNTSPMTIKPGQKTIMTSSKCQKFAEKKLEIEMNGKKFEGYTLTSYVNDSIAVKDEKAEEASKE